DGRGDCSRPARFGQPQHALAAGSRWDQSLARRLTPLCDRLTTMLSTIWSVVTLPFRLVGLAVEMVGRAMGVLIGFVLMVLGVALCAAQWLPLGLPLFIVGLLVALKCLG